MRLALALLLAAAPAFAAVPEKGEGTIAILGGVRSILPGNQGFLDDVHGSHGFVQPGGIASFGYQYDDELHFKIEVGYLVDRYHVPGSGDLQVKTIPILLALDTVLVQGQAFTF